MEKTLIVVDMQNDFVYGPLGTDEARAIVPNVKKKIEEYVAKRYMIYYTKDAHYNNYFDTHEGRYLPIKHCERGEHGWKIIDDIPDAWDNTWCQDLVKNSFGYQYWQDFKSFKEGKRSIELVGVCTDICVVSNALILRSMYPEMDITVDASCCAGTTPEKHKAALEVMKSCHIDIINE